jgi:hypothetical protein
MKLSANGPGWQPYNLSYRGIGNIPSSSDTTKQWSSWNVVDEDGNYYGTINLNCDGTTAAWNGYNAGQQGYYLKGIEFGPVQGQTHAYQLAVQEVIRPSQKGPFPNTSLATPALYPGTQQRIVLGANGDRIVNDRGTPVLLKGVVRPSLEWNIQGQYLSASDIATMRGWGANIIRIPLNQAWWLASAPRTATGSYKQIVDAMIYYAIQQGMAVILDLHWIDSTVRQAEMANQDSITFWQDIAGAYADFGTVLFELYNEPFKITQQQWLSGGGGYVGFQHLYNAVRAAGASNLCIVGGLDWAYDLEFVSSAFCVQGTGIVYCSHPYNPKGTPGYGPFAANFAGVLGTFPVIFTEFGGNTAATYNDIDYYNTVISYVNTNGIHYTAFAWWVEPSNPQFPTLIGDWTGTAIYGGEVVHRDLQTKPGTPLAGT